MFWLSISHYAAAVARGIIHDRSAQRPLSAVPGRSAEPGRCQNRLGHRLLAARAVLRTAAIAGLQGGYRLAGSRSRQRPRARRPQPDHRRRADGRCLRCDVDRSAARSRTARVRHRQRHAHEAQRSAGARRARSSVRRETRRHSRAAQGHPGRDRREASGTTPAHGRHRLRGRQEIHGAGAGARAARRAGARRRSARPVRPAS